MAELYIDTLEIEEILGELYDFSTFTEKDWLEIDAKVVEELERRGLYGVDEYTAEEYDMYMSVIDGVILKHLSVK